MVDKCANPRCQSPFRYFGRGRLFAFELRNPVAPCKDVPRTICERHPSHATICFWLCEQCARHFVVSFSHAAGMRLLPRNTAASHPLQDAGDFQPVIPGGNDEVLPGVPL